MHSSKLVNLVLFAVAVSLAHGSDVLEYKDSDFEDKIATHDVALVEFYAPWCGHCKRLAPEYELAATALKANDPPVPLIKVDCTVETATCGKHGVNGYPTLKIFKNGAVASDYNGPREADGIVKYMRTKAGPSARELADPTAAAKFLEHAEHAVVGFACTSSGEALLAEFKKAADALAEQYRFAYTTNPAVCAKYKYDDKVVVFQPPRLQVKLLPSESVYEGAAQSAKIKTFVQQNIHGLVGHRTTGNSADFKNPLVVVYYNVDYVKDVKGTNYVRNRIIKVAQKFTASQGLTFAISNTDEFKSELAEFGIDSPRADAKYIIGRGPNGEKYKFEGEYSVENLEKFANDLLAKKLEQYLKSEPIPEPSSDAVQTVVARNFDEVVNDPSKDVLIEFYAPWCGHCKSLAPKYEELAKKLKGESDIVIAKMDATANDVPPQFEVRGFPTIFFASKKNKQNPRKYEGGREVDDFVKFLAKEATDPLVGFDRAGKKTKKTEL